jgi:hypothetical protein
VLKVILCVLSVFSVGFASAGTPFFKCESPDGKITFSATILEQPFVCKDLIQEAYAKSESDIRRYNARVMQLKKYRTDFQKNLKVGDYSYDGLVIEVKRPIAKIQTRNAEKWFKIDELMPQDYLERSQRLRLEAGDGEAQK